MRSSTTQLPTHDAVRLTVHHWAPESDDQVRGCVVVVHGMVEHAARYTRLGSALAAAGYAVYAPDLRGHGRTASGPDDVGHLGSGDWEAIVDDIGLLVAQARADHPGVPVVLLGHSMGSLLSRRYAIERGASIDALVLSGTPGDPGPLGRVGEAVAATEARLRGPRHRSELLDSMMFGPYRKAFAPNRTRSDWLSRDDAEVDAYEADPSSGVVATASFVGTMLRGMRGLEDAAEVGKVPAGLSVLVMAGDRDPSAANGRSALRIADLYRKAGLTDVRVRLYPGARHEVFNETNRAEVVAELLDWLDERIPAVRP